MGASPNLSQGFRIGRGVPLVTGRPGKQAGNEGEERLNRLLQQFKEVDRLPDEKKAFIKRVLDALLVKEKLRELAS